jgi:hypothetical protein
MGTWGAKIFNDDVALDVKGIFEDAIEEGKTSDEATKIVYSQCGGYFTDDESGPTAYWALALMQLQHGALQEEVRQKALDYIEKGTDLVRWEGATARSRKSREKVIHELRTILLHPESYKPKKKRKEKEPSYKEGDWFAVPLSDDTYGIGILARIGQDRKYKHELFAYLFGPKRKEIPELSELEKLEPKDSVWHEIFAPTSFTKGSWQIIGKSESWNREKWRMPLFSGWGTQVGDPVREWPFVLVEYDDNNPGMRKMFYQATEEEFSMCSRYGSYAGYDVAGIVLEQIFNGERKPLPPGLYPSMFEGKYKLVE